MSSDDPRDAVEVALRGQYVGFDDDVLGVLIADVKAHETFTLWAGNGGWEVSPSIPYGAESLFVTALVERHREEGWEMTAKGPGRGAADDRRASLILPSHPIRHSAILGLSDPPAWVPIPVGAMGSLATEWGPDVIEPHSGSVDKSTQKYLLDRRSALFEVVKGHQDHLIDMRGAYEIAEKLSEAASELIKALVPSFPPLRLRVNEPLEWIDGLIVIWLATDQSSGSLVRLSALSEAQQRWASLAIHTAM